MEKQQLEKLKEARILRKGLIKTRLDMEREERDLAYNTQLRSPLISAMITALQRGRLVSMVVNQHDPEHYYIRGMAYSEASRCFYCEVIMRGAVIVQGRLDNDTRMQLIKIVDLDISNNYDVLINGEALLLS